MRDLNIIRSKKGFISDMDGVIYQGSTLIPGVKDFVTWLQKEKKQFLFLTNSSERTPLELRKKLQSMGLDIEESHFYTSALATAHFLKTQAPGCSAYIIGAHGLINALYEVGIPFNDVNPEYVVVGETTGYNYEMIIKATELINKGAKLIGTNGDMTSPSDRGVIPACRALIAPIELATGKKAYFIGKPNPLMMRTGLKKLGVHSEEAVMIGDRMDTDIIGGVESGMETVLVMSGLSNRESIKKFSYQPHYILDRVGDLVPKKQKLETTNFKLDIQKGTVLTRQPLFHICTYLTGNWPYENAQDGAGEDVAREMHKQIHAGKGDDTGQAISGHAQAPAEAEQDCCTGKEKEGMA